MRNLDWTPSNLSSTEIPEIYVAQDGSTDKTFVLADVQTRNDQIMNFVDDAQQEHGITFNYNELATKSLEWLQDIMDRMRDSLITDFRSFKNRFQGSHYMPSIDPILRQAIFNMKTVRPDEITITGSQRQLLVCFEIAMNH